MKHEQLFDDLLGFHAWDEGATDSGIKDDMRRAQATEQIDNMNENELRLALSPYVAEVFLSEDAIAEGYGWEDALSFLTWIKEGEYCVF